MHDKPGFKRFDLGSDEDAAATRMEQLTEDSWVIITVIEAKGTIVVWAKRGY